MGCEWGFKGNLTWGGGGVGAYWREQKNAESACHEFVRWGPWSGFLQPRPRINKPVTKCNGFLLAVRSRRMREQKTRGHTRKANMTFSTRRGTLAEKRRGRIHFAGSLSVAHTSHHLAPQLKDAWRAVGGHDRVADPHCPRRDIGNETLNEYEIPLDVVRTVKAVTKCIIGGPTISGSPCSGTTRLIPRRVSSPHLVRDGHGIRASSLRPAQIPEGRLIIDKKPAMNPPWGDMSVCSCLGNVCIRF